MEPVAPEVHQYLTTSSPRPAEMQAMKSTRSKQVSDRGRRATSLSVGALIGAKPSSNWSGYDTDGVVCAAVKENGGGKSSRGGTTASRSARAASTRWARRPHQYRVSEATVRCARPRPHLIFNDIEKDGYPASLPIIKEKLRPGGLLITDNMLFHGAIFDPQNHTKSVEGVREFTRLVMNDPTLTASIVPIRDGLLVAQRASR
jgi:hypothetical protein